MSEQKQKKRVENHRILVTGGAGFIGSHLCENLLRQNNQIVCLDDFSTGYRSRIEPFLNDRNFRLIEGDIRDLRVCRKAVEGVDYVLHQAALVSVPRSIKNPILMNDVNVNGFLNVLLASRDEGVKRFIFATSSSIYGDHPELPKQEDRLGNPISPYAVSKRANELYASVFSMLYGIQTIGLRYFNVFGPRQDPNGPYAAVIPRFITGLLKYDHPVIYGDGSFTRDFTYVENIVHANQLAMVAEKEEAINKVYNIAGGERTAIKELANILNTYLSKFDSKIANIKIIHEKERLGDIPHSYADIENARRLLGYRAWVSVKEGLHRTCEWFQKQNLSPE